MSADKDRRAVADDEKETNGENHNRSAYDCSAAFSDGIFACGRGDS